MTAWRRRHGAFAVAALSAVGLVLAAYANHFDNAFQFDDSHVIVNNLAIRSLHDVGRFFRDASTFSSLPQNASYRPLLTLSYAFDYWLGGGLAPRVFHRTQFALLLLLGLALALFYRRLADLGHPGPANRHVALFAATLFCVHTANTETINYLSSRSDLVSTLGVVASFLLWVLWPRGRRTLLYLVPMLLGGLAKPPTVMFAPLLVLFELFFAERCSLGELTHPRSWPKLGRALLRGLPALVVGAAWFVVLRLKEPEALLYATVDRWTYMISQPRVWLHYFLLFFWPTGLTADTDWQFLDDFRDWRLVAGLLFVAALAAAIVLLSRTDAWRPAAFGLAWFALALLPSSSLFPLSEVCNEHRVFFPYAGLAFAATWCAWRGACGTLRAPVLLPPRRAIAVVLAAVGLLAALAAATRERNRVWKDDLTLWQDVARKSPANGRGLMNYGLALMSRGRVAEALVEFERAHELLPNYPVLEVNLGIAKSALGRVDEGELHFRRALALAPEYGQAHYFYASWLLEQGRGPEALRQLATALVASPLDLEAHQLGLRLYAAAGREAELAALVQDTLRIAPSDPLAGPLAASAFPVPPGDGTARGQLGLGRWRIDQKQWLEGALANREALRLDPTLAEAWNNLGWALGQLGFHAEAAPCFRRAFELDPTLEIARNNLAWLERQAADSRASRD